MKKTIKIITVFVAIVMLFPAVFSLAEGIVIPEYEYNEHDLAVVQNFLEQEVNGKKNGVIMFGEKYDVNNPETWEVDKTQFPGYLRPIYNIAPFVFNSGYLTRVNFGYCYYEQVDGVHADGIRFLPVGGDFIFEGCGHLEDVFCGNQFNKFIVKDASPKFRYWTDFGTRFSSEVYLPVASGIGYISVKSDFPTISAGGYRDIVNDNDTLVLRAEAYADAEKKNAFVGWVNRITGEMYSTESTLRVNVEKIGRDFACALEAVYEESQPFAAESDIKTLPLGDANNDMHINTGDAVEVLKASTGAESNRYQQVLADMNKDGTVNTGDAVAILKLCSKLG